VILFTGHGDLFKQDEAMAAGISAVCSKSEPIKNLLEKARILTRGNAVGAFH